MQLLRDTWFLVKKDVQLELRQRYAISGILLYVLSTVFVVYLSVVEKLPGAVWAAMLWIIILFASVNAVAKSFVQEGERRQLYYYTLVSPSAIILAKMLYNTLLLLLLSLLSYGAFSLVMSSPVKEQGLFFLTLFLGSMGFSITFTFISAIAAKAGNSGTLMAILSFPVILPILLTLLRLSKQAIQLMEDNGGWDDIVMLLSIDVILIALAFMLFPFLWRD